MRASSSPVIALLAVVFGACGQDAPAPRAPDARQAAEIETPSEALASDAGPGAGARASGPGVIVIMDSSGSMWGQIDGMTKRDIARQAVRDLTAARPEVASAGLIAYGHRRQGDCNDIELVRLPGADAPLADAVDLLVPTGKTPLTAAVRTAADALQQEGVEVTVILVTDGVETCNADPCAAGAEIAARAFPITVHIVGFGLSAEEGRQVSCLAELTGGRYLGAASASDLAQALDKVAATVEDGSPEAATASATLSAPATVEIGAPFQVSWTGPGGPSDYVDLVPPGHQPLSGELSYAYTGASGPVTLRAPATPGDYMLRYIWLAPQGRQSIATAAITVTDAQIALAAPASVGAGATFAVTWRGPDAQGDYVDLVKRGETRTSGEIVYAYTASGNPAELQAPGEAGAYDIRYILSGSDKRRVLKTLPLTVSPATAQLAFRPFAALGEMLDIHWSGPAVQGDYIDIVPRGHTDTRGEISYAYARTGNPATLRLPGEPGAYDVRYVLDAPGGRRVLATAPLILHDVAVSLSPARTSASAGDRISVAWSGPGGQADYIDIVPRGFTGTSGELSYAYLRGGSPVSIQLPGDPGPYDLRYVLEAPEGRSVKAVVPLRVDAAIATLDFPARVSPGATLGVAWTGPGHEGDYVDIIAAGSSSFSGQTDYAYVRYGSPAQLEAPSARGTYDVRYVVESANGLRVVTRAPLVVE